MKNILKLCCNIIRTLALTSQNYISRSRKVKSFYKNCNVKQGENTLELKLDGLFKVGYIKISNITQQCEGVEKQTIIGVKSFMLKIVIFLYLIKVKVELDYSEFQVKIYCNQSHNLKFLFNSNHSIFICPILILFL